MDAVGPADPGRGDPELGRAAYVAVERVADVHGSLGIDAQLANGTLENHTIGLVAV